MDLFLSSYGTYLHVREGMFEVSIPAQDGQPARKQQVAAKRVRTIVMGTSGALSTDAIQLALEHNVDILFADRGGDPIGRVWHPKLGSTTSIRKRQLEASLSNVGVRHVCAWLTEKLDRQARLLEHLRKHRDKDRARIDERAAEIRGYADKLAALADAPTIDEVADTIRGLEGTAGRRYFELLSGLTPKRYRFSGRSMRPAADAFNAYLNYGYAILYNRVEKALMIAGVEPYLGFLHRDGYNQKSMIFDFIEPYRVYVDHVVFRLFAGKRVNDQCFAGIPQGVTLEKPGKQQLVEALYKYLDEDKTRHRGRNVTRQHGLQLDAHRFANELIGR